MGRQIYGGRHHFRELPQHHPQPRAAPLAAAPHHRLTAFALITVACGGDDDTGAAEPAATEAPDDSDAGDGDGDPYADLSGEIRIDGSSTVFPIAEAMAEEFGYVSDVRVNVAFSGTGGGFEKFCRGETQISDASVPSRTARLRPAPRTASTTSSRSRSPSTPSPS